MWSVISGQASSTRGGWVGDFIQVSFRPRAQSIFAVARGPSGTALSWGSSVQQGLGRWSVAEQGSTCLCPLSSAGALQALSVT